MHSSDFWSGRSTKESVAGSYRRYLQSLFERAEIRRGKRPDRHFSYSGLISAHNAALKASATSFDIYSLRHTFATRLYAKTKDLVAVQLILGHADLKTVMRYVHVDQAHITAAMQLYEETIRPLPEDFLQRFTVQTRSKISARDCARRSLYALDDLQ